MGRHLYFLPSPRQCSSDCCCEKRVPQLTQLEVRPKILYQGGEGPLLTLWYPQLIALTRIPSLPLFYLPLSLSVLRPEASF